MGTFKKIYQNLTEEAGQKLASPPRINPVAPQTDKDWGIPKRRQSWSPEELRGLMDPNAMPPEPEPEDPQWDFLKGQSWDADSLKGLMDPNEPQPRQKLPPLQNKTYIRSSQVPDYVDYLRQSRAAKPKPANTEFDDVDFSQIDADQDTLRGLLDPTDANYKAPPHPFKALNIPTSLDTPSGVNANHPPMSDDKTLGTSAKQLYVIRASRMGVPDSEIMSSLVNKYGTTPAGAKSLMNKIRKGWNTHMTTTESFFGDMFRSKGPASNPLLKHPKFGTAFAQLVKQFGGDEKKAEEELQRLQQSSFGQYQLQRLSSGIGDAAGAQQSGTPDDAKFQQGWGANQLGGKQMFGEKPGSYQ